ncbi:cutinase family protein [Cutibacterium sp. V947]|uniref:cutinase family protein n=1 Tax=unclassified Cutibacterium TaxID=2649671 RepID=UPI003EDF51BA
MGWDSDPVSSELASRMGCASVMFVGVRGSGETPPFGSTITSVRDALAQKWKGRGTVRQVYLDYPAADPHTLQRASMSSLLFDATMPSTEYFDSAALGAKKLTTLLNEEKKQCPKEWVVLAGFSQGSQAITQALAQTDTPQRLAGALLAGNPDHYPGQNVQELSGDADQSAIGMAAMLYYLRERANATPGADRDSQMRAVIKAALGLSQESIDHEALDADMVKVGAAIPAEAYPETYSVCMKGDPVCDAAPALTRILTLQSTWQDELNQGRPIHMGYTRTILDASLDRIAQRANAVGAAEAKGAPLPHGQPVTVSTRQWGPLQIGVAVGAGVLGLALGWFLGRTGQRRQRRHHWH